MMVRGFTEDQVRQAVEAIGVALNGDVPQVGARASFSVRPERLRIQPDGAARETRRNVYAARVASRAAGSGRSI